MLAAAVPTILTALGTGALSGEKEQREGDIAQFRAVNVKLSKLLGIDQSEEVESNQKSKETSERSFSTKRRTEEDTLDSLSEIFKKRGTKISKRFADIKVVE